MEVIIMDTGLMIVLPIVAAVGIALKLLGVFLPLLGSKNTNNMSAGRTSGADMGADMLSAPRGKFFVENQLSFGEQTRMLNESVLRDMENMNTDFQIQNDLFNQQFMQESLNSVTSVADGGTNFGMDMTMHDNLSPDYNSFNNGFDSFGGMF